MSQHHIFHENKKGVIGYDQRLDGYFMHICDGSREFPYTSLSEEQQYPKYPDKYLAKLEEHGFTIDDHFRENLMLEAVMPIGSKVIKYKLENGKQTPIES